LVIEHPLTWVIGAGGLLGRAIVTSPYSKNIWSNITPINWEVQTQWSKQFEQKVIEFKKSVGKSSWSILWCAGKGTVSSSRDVLKLEGHAISLLVEALIRHFGENLSQGTFFFSSSAGAIHSGVDGKVANELSTPTPLTFYGEEKLAVEKYLFQIASDTGLRVLVGRLSNLYGPNQNLRKPQGLISNICAMAVRRMPIPIFVSLRTVRNYLYCDDAASQIWNTLEDWRLRETSQSGVQLFHSKHDYSVGEILKLCTDIVGIDPLVHFYTRPDSANLSYSTYFSSLKLSEKSYAEVPIEVGIQRTFESVLSAYRKGLLVG